MELAEKDTNSGHSHPEKTVSSFHPGMSKFQSVYKHKLNTCIVPRMIKTQSPSKAPGLKIYDIIMLLRNGKSGGFQSMFTQHDHHIFFRYCSNLMRLLQFVFQASENLLLEGENG
jgi:threonyl-tRNA synthetase